MTTAPTPVRDTILITHANPEDNRFARWLAGRLTTAGYKVWVDVRALRGGDDFWDKIEHVLRHEAIKQIVVVSEHIGKQGVKKELALGDVMRRKLSDPEFMVPIRIADVDFGEFPTEIIRQNAHNAFPNWAACLQPLFETLDTSRVPKRTVESWSLQILRRFTATGSNSGRGLTSGSWRLRERLRSWKRGASSPRLPTSFTREALSPSADPMRSSVSTMARRR
jgi:hypothetical protein